MGTMSAAAETIEISSRFNGPRESGNGGYTSGVLANRLEGAVEVNLRSPVPLELPLDLAPGDDGSLSLRHGETAIAEARSLPDFELDLPQPVTIEQARAAATRYRGSGDTLFGTCFVCGPAREDSFEVFAGQVERRDVVATPWIPPEWTADAAGNTQSEFVWAALDCPTYFACHLEGELTLSMLVRQRAEMRGPVRVGEEHVVMAWPIAIDGRKRLAGAAVLAADGKVRAAGEVLLIEPRASD